MCIRDSLTAAGLAQASRRRSQLGADTGITPHDCQSSALTQSQTFTTCLLYTSDAADERSSVDLGGRRIIKKKKQQKLSATEQIPQKKNKQTAGTHNDETPQGERENEAMNKVQ